MKPNILLTNIKNKVKDSPHLPYKHKEIVYHILRKVWEEYQKESVVVDTQKPDEKDWDLPPGFDFLFRDRSKQ